MYDWATTAAALALGCTTILYIGRRALKNQPPYPLPPGPAGLPWVGNVVGLNVSAPWTTYAEWGRTYGNIVYSRLLGRDIIILNSENIAKDLLERRAENYSDRPDLIAVKLCGQDWNSILLPYGDRWRSHRRLFHQTYRPDALSRFLPSQHRKACDFLRRLLDSPERLNDHVFKYTASVVLNSTYDYDPTSPKDELVDITAEASKIILFAVRPDITVAAGTFPFLLHLPSWFPGMSFKEPIAPARTFAEQYLKRPFEYSVQKVMRGSTAPSMVNDALGGTEEKGISHSESLMEALKEASGTALLAASETSHLVLMTVFSMMALNPAVQERAQAQIDAVVGKARLPTIDDRPLLPLIDAIFWETLRCQPIAPLSIPHAAVDDDVYNGFHIPKGAIVLANVWAMGHDESRFPNPHTFTPERFLNEDGSLKPNEVEHLMFGFGRRMCVGRHFGDMLVWGLIARALAVFKILKPLGENGIHPYRIVPRIPGMDSEKLEQLIAASTA